MKVRGLLIIILIGIVAPLFLITVLRDSQANSETIAIIGTGNVGSTLGKIWAAKGHEIIYGSRTPTSTRNPEKMQCRLHKPMQRDARML